MPYPIALAGLALSAAGAGMGVAGAAKSREAMDDAQTAELLRQQDYQQEADTSFQNNLQRSDRPTADAEQAAGASRREAEAADIARTGAGMTPPIAAPQSAGVKGATQRSAATARAAGNAWSRLVGAARARLEGADDWQLEQGIANQRTNQDLGIVSSKARGSAAILPYEMNEASHAGDGLRGWGQLVSALGSVTGMYGAVTPAAGATNGFAANADSVKTLVDAPAGWGQLNVGQLA